MTRVWASADFEQRIDERVLALSCQPALTFHALLNALPSVYPTVVLQSISRLSESGLIDPNMVGALQTQASVRDDTMRVTRTMLPLPHPVEYEWRFCPDTSQHLLEVADEMACTGTPIILFGTPGVAVEALHLPINRRLIFIGENNSVTQRLKALNDAAEQALNLQFCASPYPQMGAGAVIVDPPWYLDFVKPMLAIAAHTVGVGGLVFISLPPEGVRPSAAEDQATLIRRAGRLGLRLHSVKPLSLHYETPFFEQNALSAAGIGAARRWRRGDLFIFEKVRIATTDSSLFVSRKREWSEFTIGRMRLFVRRSAPARCSSALSSLVEGDILPTVSRRDPQRRNSSVVTSGNRFFASSNPELVAEAALSLCKSEFNGGSRQPLWSNNIEAAEVERIADVLKRLSDQEAAEERATLPSSPFSEGLTCKYGSTNFSKGLPEVRSGPTT
ncbi:hypothetical protein PY650_26770 [Rhizobium calliandrae]|uniref:Uncharacterized protein n=1 Tax=Rhizobium calliandrae TaxID=1312182 RepID=A0ABT7KML1_9HYPH|nr:hypothetical protein [Rhizobium calliandrae]MDL2409173.1 hypothetical protein [Rhizobium calliandrae]